MNRRAFVRDVVSGVVGVSGLAARVRNTIASVLSPAEGAPPVETSIGGYEAQRLFPINLPNKEWAQFRAAGFAEPACGVIFRRADDVTHGMPLGGISTGFLDVETDGTLGVCTLFNSGVPIRGPLRLPFLGVNVDGYTWTLTRQETVGTGNAKEIHYWGHYPIVDIEYETTAPVSVGLRAWTPFIPGDVVASSIPATVFEVHLRNTSSNAHQVTVAFSFPGPTQAEAQICPGSLRMKEFIDWVPVSEPVLAGLVGAQRQEISVGEFYGLAVSSPKGTGYALGTIGQEKPRFGAGLGRDGYELSSGQEWSKIDQQLPPEADTDPSNPRGAIPETEFSSSLAVDLALKPGERRVVRIVLTWFSPFWNGEAAHSFKRMYAKRYQNATAVADDVVRCHESLLSRTIAWQQTIYTENGLPVWLRESLVNILHLITKTSYWAQAKPPIGDWCREEDGLFGMNECPRECPQIECIPCSFYGNIPLVYFFPDLALSTLRGYKAYQYPNGAAPWVFGGCTSGAAQGFQPTDGAEMAIPSPGYQTTLNGACYVDMVDRYWQRTGDDELVKEFYPSVKKNTIYTMNLRSGPDGIVSVPEGNRNPTQPTSEPGAGLEWFENLKWFGMTPHVGGIHLAQVRMAKRMAEKVGDKAFVEQCQQWLKQGSESMENGLWTGQYYLAYYEPDSGKKSDLVFAYQLDGDWMCFYHGLPGVFRQDRAKITLETIKRLNVSLTSFGVASFARPEGGQHAWNDFYGLTTTQIVMLAGLYMYKGASDLGLELVRRCMHNVVIRLRKTWDIPVHLRPDTGEVTYGADYYQNLVLWSLPAALEGKDIAAFCASGGLIDRMLRAGKTT